MFSKVFITKVTVGKEFGPPSDERGDCACMVDKNGNVDNIKLHEQMEEGVDRTEIMVDMRKELSKDFSKEWLDRYYPLP